MSIKSFSLTGGRKSHKIRRPVCGSTCEKACNKKLN